MIAVCRPEVKCGCVVIRQLGDNLGASRSPTVLAYRRVAHSAGGPSVSLVSSLRDGSRF